jgi:hypothetical protein
MLFVRLPGYAYFLYKNFCLLPDSNSSTPVILFDQYIRKDRVFQINVIYLHHLIPGYAEEIHASGFCFFKTLFFPLSQPS